MYCDSVNMAMDKRILLLDSDQDVLIGLERVLENEGMRTTVTWHQHEAMKLLSSDSIEVVVVGHHPPEINAADVLMVTEPGKKKPCVVLHTNPRHPFEADYLRSLGAEAVLEKWQEKEITAKLKAIMEERRLPQAG